MSNDHTEHPHEHDDAQELWRRILGDATPLPARSRAPRQPHDIREPVRALRTRRHNLATTLETPDIFSPHGAHHTQDRDYILDSRLKRRISKGKERIEAVYDLHGMSLAGAHSFLQHALVHAHQQRLRTVLVITGKGKQEEGILRRSVPLWLHHATSQHIVQAYEHASPHHGGSGAFYVRLHTHTAL